MSYRNRLTIACMALLSFFMVQTSFAQSRNVGAQSFVMDDNAGHFYTLQAPAGMTGPLTFTFPIPPIGATAGFVSAGTAAGQTLFWNSTNLDWEPSNVITNNTNGNGTNVTITAPLNGVLGSVFTGNGVGNTLTVGNAGAGDGLTVNNTGTGKALNATGPVAVNGTLDVTGASNIGSNAGNTNHYGDGATLNFYGETGANNRFGIAATTNSFGGTALAVAQANNYGNTSAATTVTNTVGQAGIVGATVNTTIGGGAGTSNVVINSSNWNASAAGVITASSVNAINSLNAGNAAQFAVNGTGNVTKINNVTTSFPAVQGGAGAVLTNDGAGTLTWVLPNPSFSAITSGTNNIAGMVVGTGASLNYVAGGTINASSLQGATWSAPGSIGLVTPNAGAFTTLTSSGNTTVATGANTTNTFGNGGGTTANNFGDGAAGNDFGVLATTNNFGGSATTNNIGAIAGTNNYRGTSTFTGLASAGVVHTDGTGVLSTSQIVNADVSNTAAIAYSKLNLSAAIQGSDIASGTFTTTNANIAIGNNDNASRELRLLEPSGSGVNYTSFTAQPQATSQTYTMPAAGPTADGQTLTVSSHTATTAVLGWASAGSTPAFTRTAVASGATYNATTTDNFLGCNTSTGAITINLPSAAAAGAGHTIIVKDEDITVANTITINRTGTDLVEDGTIPSMGTSVQIANSFSDAILRFYSDGVNKWYQW